jgi:hypothetical protein
MGFYLAMNWARRFDARRCGFTLVHWGECFKTGTPVSEPGCGFLRCAGKCAGFGRNDNSEIDIALGAWLWGVVWDSTQSELIELRNFVSAP